MTSCRDLTVHAAVRMAQRGFADDDVELIYRIGTEVEGGYLVREKDFQALERKLKLLLERARRMVGARLVVEDDRLITVYRATRDNHRRLLRRAEARSSME